MAKTNSNKKYSGFRDFYEDEGRKAKPKLNESRKQKDKFKHQVKFIDPNNIKEDDWDEYEEFDKVK
jgi:hypothetical protein